MDKGPTTTGTQSFALSPEARTVLMRELADFQGYALPAQAGEEQNLLSFLATPRAEAGTTPMGRTALASVRHAPEIMQRAADDAGLHPEGLSHHIETLRASAPQLLEYIRGLADKYALGTNSLTDPRFASFLAPVPTSSSTTEPSTGAQVTQGVGAAIAVKAIFS